MVVSSRQYTLPFVLLTVQRRSISLKEKRTRVAIVGSGPSGLFACSSLLRRLPWLSIDVIEASPVPYGLVRYGVAPDHQDVKNCIHSFEKMFSSHSDRLSLYCNIRVGNGPNEISVTDLRSRYSSILLAYGASRPRKLNIPGADAKNVLSGSDLVSWYNGRPSSPTPLLDHSSAVIVGNGNVSLDCGRVLALKERLEHTDIPDSALDVLRKSAINRISIIGRRGPGDVSFTIKELREQFRLEGWSVGADISIDDKHKLEELLPKMDRPKKRLMKVLLDNVRVPTGDRTCSFLFRRRPKEILTDDNGRVRSIIVEMNDGKTQEIEAGLVVASLGYEAILLDGLPKNEKGELAMIDDTRVAVEGEGASIYAAGWCVGGARGVIADSQGKSSRVAGIMADDIKEGSHDEGLESLARAKGIRFSGWKEWHQIDEKEIKEGERRGKIREKIVTF